MKQEPRAAVGDRVLDVLECFLEGPWRQTLDDVHEATGIPRTTTHRILRLLTRRGWLAHSPGGYQLGPRVLDLGRGTVGYQTLRAAAAAALLDLHRASNAVAHLSVLEGAMTCHLDKVGSGPNWHEVPSHIGVQLPATETAGGLAILAYLPPEKVDEVLALQAEAGVAPVDRESLDRELAAIRRRQGVALRAGSSRPSGISSAAAAIQGPTGPVATLSIAWRTHGPSPAQAATLIAQAARRVTVELQR